MEPTHLARLVPGYVLALFTTTDTGAGTGTGNDGAGTGDGTGTGDGATNGGTGTGTGNNGGTNGSTNGGSGTRGRDGRFTVTIPETDDVPALRSALREAVGIVEGANTRISELNTENERSRRRFNELRTEHQAVSQRVNANEQRAIRGDVRVALTDAGAIHPKIVDLFLSDHKDKVKIDPATGETVGIHENLEAWKTANAVFFKPATGDTGDTNGGDGTGNNGGANGGTGNGNGNGGTGTGANGGTGNGGTNAGANGNNGNGGGTAGAGGNGNGGTNRTGTGGSTNGGTGQEGNGNTHGLPNLRDLTPAERKKAIKEFARRQNGAPQSSAR